MTRNRVPDEQYGLLSRRIDDVKRRVDDWSIPFGHTMGALQLIAEGDFHALSFFERDMRIEKDWELVEDIDDKVVHIRRLLAVSPFRDGEEKIPAAKFLKFATIAEALFGQRQAEHILGETAFYMGFLNRHAAYPFPGTVWRTARGRLVYPILSWGDDDWEMQFRQLDWPFLDSFELVRPQPRK